MRLPILFLSLSTNHLTLLHPGRRLAASLWINLAWKSCPEHRGTAEGRRRMPGWKRGPLSDRLITVSRPAPRILAAHLTLPQRESGRFLFVETNAGTQNAHRYHCVWFSHEMTRSLSSPMRKQLPAATPTRKRSQSFKIHPSLSLI